MAIKAGDRVRIKLEWRDSGDEEIEFVAVYDEEEGRVTIEARLGLPINPTQVVGSYMIEKVGPAAELQAKLIQIRSQRGLYFFHREEEWDGRVLFSPHIEAAYRFATSEEAHRMRESSRFFFALGKFEQGNVSIVTEGGTE